MLFSVMVEQDALFLMAVAASVKVHELLLSASSVTGTAWINGSRANSAMGEIMASKVIGIWGRVRAGRGSDASAESINEWLLLGWLDEREKSDYE